MSVPGAVLFDLLTALLDSWSVWNAAAESERAGRAWRTEYLRLTYGCGARPHRRRVFRPQQPKHLRRVVCDFALGAFGIDTPIKQGARKVLA